MTATPSSTQTGTTTPRPTAPAAAALAAEIALCGWRQLFMPDAPPPRLPEALTVAWWRSRQPWLLRHQHTGIAHQLEALEQALAAIAWIRLDNGPEHINDRIAQAMALIDSAGLRRLRSRLRVLRRQALHVAHHYQGSLLCRSCARLLEHIAATARVLHDHLDAPALRQSLARAERLWAASDTVRRAREMQALVQGLVERLRSMDAGGASSMSGHIVPAFRTFEQDPGEATREPLARHMHAYAHDLWARVRRLLALSEPPHGAPLPLDRSAADSLCRFLDGLPPEQVLLKVAELSKLGALAQQLLGPLAAGR
ncbi:hypothetical protein [Ideonella alba]|uniref:Uncharacterized protein n=1 Tax=Ideonella alba TaxID=2824118 RepID=A0A940Y9Y0_9BURK|nr:hypothetical protein [Ideonella alba]MBQ0931573.1 hypothetical protein [Ideonella alba]